MNENHVLQDDLKVLQDSILRSPKNPVIAHLSVNSLKNKINDLSILIQDFTLNYFIFIYLSIYLFIFPCLPTLSILHTEKIHCCRNITS